MSQPWYVVQRTFRGYTRTTELSLWGRVFVPCVLLQGLLTTGLSVALALIATDCLVSIVLAMLTLTILFAAYFAVEAVRTENVFQLCAYIGASSAGTLGIVLSISQRDDAGQDLRTAFMSPSEEGQLIRWLMFGAASLQLLSFLLALLTCSGTGELRGFGMRTYKKVGTDPALIRRYRRYQQFCSGLKLDLLFQAGVISLCVLGFDKFSWQWRLSWSEGPPTRMDGSAPSARLGPPGAQAAPTHHPGAPAQGRGLPSYTPQVAHARDARASWLPLAAAWAGRRAARVGRGAAAAPRAGRGAAHRARRAALHARAARRWTRASPWPEDGAPPAWLDHPKAQAAPTQPGAPPQQRGGSPWPQERASGRPKVEDLPLPSTPGAARGPRGAVHAPGARSRPISARSRRRALRPSPFALVSSAPLTISPDLAAPAAPPLPL